METRIVATNENIIALCKQAIARQGPRADLNHIDTRNVTMFNNLFGLENMMDFQGDISSWSFENARYLEKMFQYSGFNQTFTIRSNGLLDLAYMFRGSTFNQSITHWTINYHHAQTRGMFQESAFRQPDLIFSTLLDYQEATLLDRKFFKDTIDESLSELWGTNKDKHAYVKNVFEDLSTQPHLTPNHFQWSLYCKKFTDFKHPQWDETTRGWLHQQLEMMDGLEIKIPLERLGHHLFEAWSMQAQASPLEIPEHREANFSI